MHGVTSQEGDAWVGSGLRGAMCGQLSLVFGIPCSNLLWGYCILFWV